MVTNTRKPVGKDQLIPGTDMSGMETDELPGDEAVSNLITELQSTEMASVKVYRLIPNSSKLSYVYETHPADFKISDLRDIYGGGKFRIFIHAPVDGRLVLQASPTIFVEEIKQPIATANVSQPERNSEILLIAQAMQEGFKQLGELIISSRPAQQIMPQKSTLEMLQEMAMMREILTPANSASTNVNFEQSIGMFQKGLEMAKGLVPAPVGEATSTDVLLEAVKSLLPAIANAAMNQPQVTLSQPIMSQPQAELLPRQPITEEQKMFNMRRLYLGMLCDKAAKNADVNLYAELAMDSLTDEEILSVIDSPQPLEILAQINPRVNEHPEWFGKLIDAIKQFIDHEPDILTPDENGDTVAINPTINVSFDASKTDKQDTDL